MQRYTRLLKTDRQLAKRWGRLATPVAAVANVMLGLWTLRKHKVADLEIALHTERFGEEFSWLDQHVGGDHNVIRSRRQAEDLNWRYRDDPLHQYQVMTARRAGELSAFVVFSMTDQDSYIIDLFGSAHPEVRLQLLEAVVEQVRKRPIQALHTLVTSDHSLSQVLARARFRYRSTGARVVAYARPGTEVRALLDTQSAWALSHVDILA
jgi:hypothetical protein